MARKATLGEFEHLVLLAALRLREDAYAPEIAKVLEEDAKREMSRGTLYAALERLETRGLIHWDTEASTGERGGSRRRRFSVTEAGLQAVAEQRETFQRMWRAIDDPLADAGS